MVYAQFTSSGGVPVDGLPRMDAILINELEG